MAVSDLLVERLHSSGIPPRRIKMLGNAVDLSRFEARGGLPLVPVRALVFTSRAADEAYISLLRNVCDGVGIAVDVLDQAAGIPTAHPEKLLVPYDLTERVEQRPTTCNG